MLIIGERINSTRKSIAPAVKERDTAFIQEEARKQAEGGAGYLDCNAATVGQEAEPKALCWLVQTVQDAVKQFERPDPDFFARLNLPPRIPKPEIAEQVGRSILKDGQWQDLNPAVRRRP